MPTQKQNNSRKLKSRSRKRTYRRSKSIISKRSIKKKTKRKSYDGASSSSAYFAIPKIIENICDDDDFVRRYQMLTDVRERLSTLAHFWNESQEEERLDHFKFFKIQNYTTCLYVMRF